MIDAPPHSLKNSNVNPKMETTKEERVGVCSLTRNTSRVKGCAKASKWGLRQMTSESIIHMNLHRTNNKLISVWLEHFRCMDEPWAYTNS